MRVILREDVPDLGEAGDLVEVKDGYGRNYLLPRRLAIRATATTVKALAHERKLREDRLRKLRKGAEGLAERLAGVNCEIPAKVGESDRLYGSVTSMDIQEALSAQGIALDRRRILLPEPIKQLGEHRVKVRLHPEVTAEVAVKVVRAEEEKPPAPESVTDSESVDRLRGGGGETPAQKAEEGELPESVHRAGGAPPPGE